MVYYQKLFRRCSQHWIGGEGETKFVLSMFNNFVILAGMVSRVLSKIVAWLPCTCDRGIPMQLPRINLNKSSRIRKIGFHSTTILLALEIKFYFWCRYHKINFLSSSILLHVCSSLLLQTQRDIAFLRVYSRTPLTRTPKGSRKFKFFEFSGGSS
jgi:hypothetical protein